MKSFNRFMFWVISCCILAGCESNNSGGNPTPPKREIDVVLQEKILDLNGLGSIEFLSEVAGLLSANNIKSKSVHDLAEQLDILFELKCVDVCVIRKRNER